MQKGLGFWALVAGVVVMAVALLLFFRGLWAGDATQDQAWIELVTAKTADEREAVAESHPRPGRPSGRGCTRPRRCSTRGSTPWRPTATPPCRC